MMTERTDELYVGYLAPSAPVSRRLRRIAVLALALAVALGAAIAAGHRRLSASTFEFGTIRSFEGVIRESPAPMLAGVSVAGAAAQSQSAFLLVGPGKHGAADIVRGLDGERVRLSGTLVYRDGQTMVEVDPDSVVPSGQSGMAPIPVVELGEVVLSGEIVDSKCYLGVMNPGESKTHRDCAVRCISGGAPPLLVARDSVGGRMQMLLVGIEGQPINRNVLPFVAEPVEVTGRLVSMGDLFVLHTSPSAIRRLS